MLYLWIVLLLLTAGIILLISRFCYKIAFYSMNEKEQDVYAIPPGKQYEEVADLMLQRIYEAEKLEYDLIGITTKDGLHLSARYYHFRDGAPVQIMFHGYRSNGMREFSITHLLAMKIGYNVISVDERGHGKSGGHTITFGIKERYDCLEWANYAVKHFGKETPIFLSGVSMGAATVLMASEFNLPENVRCIVADCPYSSPGEIIQKVSKDVRLPVALTYPFVLIGALVFGRFKLWESSPLQAVQKATKPILVIHGEADRFVPCDMSRRICASSRGLAKLLTVPYAGHGLSYLTDADLYEKTLRNFLRSCGVIK